MVEIDPRAKKYWKTGINFLGIEAYQDAIEEFTKAINIDNKYVDAYFNRALAFCILKDFDSSIKDLLQIIDMGGASADVYILAAKVSVGKKMFNAAKKFFDVALATNPTEKQKADIDRGIKELQTE